MYKLSQSRRFLRSYRRLRKSGMFTEGMAEDLGIIVRTLEKGEALPTIYRDHALTGDMQGYRECHIKGDLLLVYGRDDKERRIDLTDIGSHSQIFR